MLATAAFDVRAADMRFAATLVWGTDETKPPPGKNYKPVDAEIRGKLKDLPFRWNTWYEVNRKVFTVPVDPSKEIAVPVSEKCQLSVKCSNNSEIEVALIGKGKEVVRRKQPLPRGDLLVLGGNAPNSTAWLVILKRIE